MKNVFQPYLDNIAETIGASGKMQKPINESLNGVKNYFEKSERSFSDNLANNQHISGIPNEHGLPDLARLLGLPFKTPTLGNHPDFKHIAQTFATENHYATAVFQDVKGSTSLFKKYNNQQIYIIIQAINVVTTHIHAIFSGHIQRLQYDGVFSYFVRKEMNEKLATFYSLCATAFSSYFIRYELRSFFNSEHGFDNIYAKTGIDYGNKEDVMWAAFGVTGCCEVSTNSLHTSLAFKIQSKAYSDKICVGANVVKLLPELLAFFTPHTTSDNSKDNIIYEDNSKGIRYEFFDFNWEMFLLELFSDIVKKDSSSKLYIDYDSDPSSSGRIAKLRWNNILTKIGLGAIDNQGKFVQSNLNDKIQITIPKSSFYYNGNV